MLFQVKQVIQWKNWHPVLYGIIYILLLYNILNVILFLYIFLFILKVF